MTLYRRGDVWHYDFRFQRQRHRGSTKQTIRDDAELVESQFKVQLRREAVQVEVLLLAREWLERETASCTSWESPRRSSIS